MLNIILDTNIILRKPKVLGITIPGISFMIPLDVVEEIGDRANARGVSHDERIDLIQKASEEGSITIVNTDLPVFRQLRQHIQASNLSDTDLSIIALAVDFKMKNQEVKIASHDKAIITFAHSNGIEVLDANEIENLISNFVQQINKSSSNLKKEISSYEKKEKKTLAIETIIGILITTIAHESFENISKIVATFNVWGTIALILILGVGLFVFRERYKFIYGVVEFLVGAITVIMPFQQSHFDFSKIVFNFEFVLKILAGLYIMVRGQDNIIKAKKDTKFGLYLKEKYKIGS